MLSFPHDYQHLIVFLQVPKSASLKNHLPWVSSFFVFADDFNKPKKKTKPNQTKPLSKVDEHHNPKISSVLHAGFSK